MGSSDSSFYAVNPDGSKKWAFVTSGASPLTGDRVDGTIYIGSGDKNLYALKRMLEKMAFATGGAIN